MIGTASYNRKIKRKQGGESQQWRSRTGARDEAKQQSKRGSGMTEQHVNRGQAHRFNGALPRRTAG
jgi:hypothetical protein